MTPAGYSEDALVEKPAIDMLKDLGLEHVDAFHEFEQTGGSPLGRETKSEVVRVSRLRPALNKLNLELPPQAIDLAIEEILRDRSRMSLAAANREVYDLIKNGVRVEIPDPEGYVIEDPPGPYGRDHLVDLSRIDFEALKKGFKKGRKSTEAEKVKGSVVRKLRQMVRLNRSRMDYLERFQTMIDAYNAGSVNIEEFFSRLMDFAQELNDEEKRGISEQLSEEELALFDLLTKPDPELTKKERKQVKKTARDLLNTLKGEKLVLDWRKRQRSRAQVRVTIEKMLDRGLPETYTRELFQQKTDAIFQYIYESYYGGGRGIYVAVTQDRAIS